LQIPSVDPERCTLCGDCGRICEYGAIAALKTRVLVFEELCHGCGGCSRVCASGAISEVPHEVGVVEIGRGDSLAFVQGRLHVGRPMSPPVIRAVKRHIRSDCVAIIDCPPGTTCPVIAAMKDADYVVLVTEPTPFGLHDLELAVETVREMGLPFGVVINRHDCGDDRVVEYCRKAGVRVLLEIPDDRRIAEAYSNGRSLVVALPEYAATFERLGRELTAQTGRCACNGKES